MAPGAHRLHGVDAVVFDLDGTLLDRRLSFERFIRDQWRRFPQVLQSVDQASYVRTAIEFDANGYGPRKDLFVSTLARFELPSELAATLLRDYLPGLMQHARGAAIEVGIAHVRRHE